MKDKLKEAVDKTLALAAKAISENDAIELAKRITQGTSHDDRRFHKVKLALRVLHLHAENERLMETCHRDRTAVHDLVKQNQLLEAQAAAMLERMEKLEREIKVLRQYGNKDCTAMADEALKALDAQPGREKQKDGGV